MIWYGFIPIFFLFFAFFKFSIFFKFFTLKIENYSLIDLYPCNIKDEESLNEILFQADTILQYFDNQEPKEEYYNDTDKMGENMGMNFEGGDYDMNFN